MWYYRFTKVFLVLGFLGRIVGCGRLGKLGRSLGVGFG